MNMLSVITINFNNRQGLADTFATVFAQEYTQFEYIVIDGGSTDGSAELIEAHADRITYRVSEKDGGIYDAMNKGIAVASGRYLNFLNSGDVYDGPGALQQCMQYAKNFPAADILYADMYLVNGPAGEPEFYPHPPVLKLKYLKYQALNQQAALLSAALFREFGNFPMEYRLASDYWLYVVSFVAGKNFVHMNFTMVRYEFTGVSLTSWKEYVVEMNNIWERFVPQRMRRGIDAFDAFKKTIPGKLLQRIKAKLKSRS